MRCRRPAFVAFLMALSLVACSDGDDRGAAISRDQGDRSASSPTTATTLPTPSTTAPVPTVPPPASAPSCPSTPRRGEPEPTRPRYTLTADVRLDENEVRGTTRVRFTPDLDTDRLVFRLWPNGPRPSAAGGSIETGDVTVDGRTAPATLDEPTILSVRPEGGLTRGRSVDVELPWTLHLPGVSRDRLARDGDAVRLGSFFPILSWEPGVGWAAQPPTGGFAEASLAPVADFDLTVTVPAGLTALASGVSDRPGHWTATAMRDVAVSVGRFTTATGTARAPDPVQVTVGVHQGIGESPEAYLAKSLEVLADFGRRFGPYPWPTFTLAITPNVGGGIEYPAHVMQGPATLTRTTSHEIAHQWFYGLVGNDQGRDPWLDEGLASWGEARFENDLAEFQSEPMPPEAGGRLGEPMTYWSSRPSIYYDGVYVQGVQALAALGAPDLVDCALRVYVATFAHRVARPADLVAALQTAFPDARSVLAGYGVR